MIRFEYNTDDVDTGDYPHNRVSLEWDGEEEDIDDMIQKFKYFLLGISYPVSLVNKVQYLTDNQMAKLRLLDEDISEL